MSYCIYPLTTLNVTPHIVVPCNAGEMIHEERAKCIQKPNQVSWSNFNWEFYRLKIANDDYSGCVKCDKFNHQDLFFYDDARLKAEYPEFADDVIAYRNGDYSKLDVPPILIVSFDPSCNLTCPICRSSKIDIGHENILDVNAMVETMNTVQSYIPHAKRVIVSGDGEACHSPWYRRILQYFDGPAKITLMSNCTLMNDAFWNSLPQHVMNAIDSIHISFNGTTKDVYEKTMRGAKFETFLENMELIDVLKAKYGFATKAVYTISQDNLGDYSNVPKFAHDKHFDKLHIGIAHNISRVVDNNIISGERIIYSHVLYDNLNNKLKMLHDEFNARKYDCTEQEE